MESRTPTDLPKAWLYRLSTKLTPQDAARLRSTCTLLLEVIDATWEPEDVPILPHRRSVPLTCEEVKAQLPPPQKPPRAIGEPWSFDYDDDYCVFDKHGRNLSLLSNFGPALTRLTANQALNMLLNKPMITLFDNFETHCKRKTEEEKMIHMWELTVDTRETWPPKGNERKSVSTVCGFGFGVTCNFPADRVTPDMAERLGPSGLKEHLKQFRVAVSNEEECLLVCDASGCRKATKRERKRFESSTAQRDAHRFDTYLGLGRDLEPLYVFLQPSKHRHTGRVKEAAAAAATASSE